MVRVILLHLSLIPSPPAALIPPLGGGWQQGLRREGIILLEKAGFSTLSAMRDTQRSRERGIINTDPPNNFYEWFSGFTDAEGNFYIHIGTICAFRFQMNLHKDDINVLHYIQKSLGFSPPRGAEVRSYKNFSSYTVTKLKDIAQLAWNLFALSS